MGISTKEMLEDLTCWIYGPLFSLSGQENLLHEICHMETLRLPIRRMSKVKMEMAVESAVSRMSPRAADWNEVLTLACEAVVANRYKIELGSDIGDLANVDWSFFGDEDCKMILTRIHQNMRTKVARVRAIRVSERIRAMHKWYRGRKSGRET